MSLLARACCTVALAFAASAALAQSASFPGRAVRIIVPFAAGGPSDILARLFGQKLAEMWGHPVIIDNRGGANGIVGTELAAKSPPDGRTLVLGTSGTHGINASLFPKLTYDTVNDFAPITRVGQIPFILVAHPSLPARSVKELLQLAKSRPGEITISSGGSPSQLAAELFKSMAHVSLLVVPYKGAALAINDVIGGQISLTFGGLSLAVPQVKAGRLRALGVTGTQRFVAAPDVPTILEAGVPGYEVSTWYGFLAPGGTPRPLVEQLNSAFLKVAHTQDIKEKLAAQGFDPVTDTPSQFSVLIAGELRKWAKVVKESGVRAE